ncbi:MAG: hypothetical protein JNK32_01975 [Anaerolineales bacterium]|nr:hypothetical protein [Anaerolineales bacterium]
MKINIFSLPIIFVLIISGCAKESNIVDDSLHNQYVNNMKLNDIEDLNKSLTISLVNNNSSEYVFGSNLEVLLQNTTTDKYIYFNPDDEKSITLSLLDESNWYNITNKVVYIGGGGILTPIGSNTSVWKTMIKPVFDVNVNNPDKLILRILVLGRISSIDGIISDELVGGYLDVATKAP